MSNLKSKEFLNNLKINEIQVDDFGRPHGVFILDKPKGITSHDVVDIVRRKLNTRAVGHTGALDPFATGMLVVLVGRYTDLSELFTGFDKSYEVGIALGLSSDTHDTEGRVVVGNSTSNLESIGTMLNTIVAESKLGKYTQEVPIYSSIKVQGYKLRDIARERNGVLVESAEGSYLEFVESAKVKRLKIPNRPAVVESVQSFEISNEKFVYEDRKFDVVNFICSVSSGTYIRSFCWDIKKRLGVSALTISLRRTRIANWKIQTDTITIEQLNSLKIS